CGVERCRAEEPTAARRDAESERGVDPEYLRRRRTRRVRIDRGDPFRVERLALVAVDERGRETAGRECLDHGACRRKIVADAATSGWPWQPVEPCVGERIEQL